MDRFINNIVGGEGAMHDHWAAIQRAQSAEAALAAFREGMAGLAGELEAHGNDMLERGLYQRGHADLEAAARIRALLEK